jgi:amphiphysin
MTTAQVRIAQTMEGFYDESAPMGQAGMEYKRVIEKLDEEARSNLVKLIKKTTMAFFNFFFFFFFGQDTAYRTTVLEPIGRFCSYFPEINEAIKRRQKKLLDYDSQKSKVRKLVDRPSEDPQRLPRVRCFRRKEKSETYIVLIGRTRGEFSTRNV